MRSIFQLLLFLIAKRLPILPFNMDQVSKQEKYIWLKNDDEKWSRIFNFEILRAPSEIPANLLGQFSLSGQIFLHWAAAALKAIVES